ncbi:MAG: hypothetical protein QGG40_14905, partial [Myxococcota bacterium]|nr:hypothetical protein [Myxococcota bacterium]
HEMLRESLAREAREEGRWASMHAACAAMLGDREGRGTRERLGRHLLEAGEPALALEPLLAGARQRIASGDYDLAHILLQDRELAMERMGCADSDERWGQGWMAQNWLARVRGELDEAEECASKTVQAAEAHGWGEIRGVALREQGRLSRLRGRPKDAWIHLLKLELIAKEQDSEPLEASCRIEMGWVQVGRGHLESATLSFRAALRSYENLDIALGMADAHLGLGRAFRHGERFEDALGHYEAARECFLRVGSRSGSAECRNAQSAVARFMDDLVTAEAHARAALSLFGAIGSGFTAQARMSLGLVLVEKQRFKEGWACIESGLTTFVGQGRRSMMALAHVSLLPCAAALHAWKIWETHIRQATSLLESTSFVDLDIARMATLGGDMARAQGRTEEAMAAYGVALGQWRSLGQVRLAGEVTDALEVLGSKLKTDPNQR